MKRGKKYLTAIQSINRNNKYTALEGLDLVCKSSTVKFDASVDVAYRLNLDPRKAEQNLRGAIVLPHGTGKVRKVLVIARGEKAREAEACGADYVGDTDYITKIQQGWFEFDVMVATPDMMAELGRLGKILGPKGLMPNPKTGTVTMDVKKAITDIKNGKVEYRVDKVGNIHMPIGKASFGAQKLAENLKAIHDQLMKIRPSTVKGLYVKNISVSSSMGPGVKLDDESIAKFI